MPGLTELFEVTITGTTNGSNYPDIPTVILGKDKLMASLLVKLRDM